VRGRRGPASARLWIALAFVASSACRSEDAAVVPEASAGSTAVVLNAVPDDSAPAGVVSGKVDGKTFGQIVSSFVIESPDSSAVTVLYLFSKPVRCVDLSFSAWDQALDPSTMILELDLVGKDAGSYRVIDAPNPSAHQAFVRMGRPATRGGLGELSATSGQVVLERRSPRGAARGAFALAFGDRPLSGRFDAEFCAGGHEP
jgi:hypothetical protein